MKVKKFVLLTAISFLCALGCACGGASQPESSGNGNSSTESNNQESSAVVETPVISVNQSSVTLGVGDTFTLTADAENIDDAAFVWAVDGDCDDTVLSLAQTGNTATITALAVGQTKLIVSLEYNGHVYFKSVDVEIKEQSDVTIVLSNNVGFDNEGYHVRLSTLSTENGDVTSISPIATVYKNNKIVPASITWTSDTPHVVSVSGNQFLSVAEGMANLVGACEIDGKTYQVNVSAEVYRPRIPLNESFVVERENLSALTISSTLKGVAREVLYNGEAVGSFDSNKNVVTLNKSALPSASAQMGEDKELVIETNLASYVVNVDLYTKIIRTKSDFENVAGWSKAASLDKALWDGYFILDSDISYNGLFQSKIADLDSLWAAVGGAWSNGGLYGFKGVFDGKGHNIEGISIDKGSQMGSIFGVLHIDGVIKNISFTKASVAANSSFVCHAGGGTVENIYIQYDSIGKGTQHYEGDGVTINSHCGSFFSFKEPTATANISNCVVDVMDAFINPNVSLKLVGSEFAAIKNCFVIGGTKAAQAKSNATLSFDSVMEFTESTNAQSRYKNFDENFWSKDSGVPISNARYAQVYNQEVNFMEEIAYLATGTSYKFAVDNHYVLIKTDNANVTVTGSVANVLGVATPGLEKVTVTATSIFDSSKQDTFTCTLVEVQKVTDLTDEKEPAFYDITVGKVYFAELGAKINGEVLYCTNADGTAAEYAQDGEEAKEMLAVTKDGYYKFNCQSVAKVIATAEDLHYIRKDYTVESYGNKGCYDGKIIGTFVMINDIDCTGLTLKNAGTYWENSRGFGGTFDGRGYTIKNLSVGQNGLFGAIAHATIKNVHFTGVCLKEADQGAYVALLSNRCFNTVIDNVTMEFVEHVSGNSAYHTSGLMFYETTFDCTFTNIVIDISRVSSVLYATECFYGADVPYLSENKSTYQNVTLIVADLDKAPVFALKAAKGTTGDIVAYPDGFTVAESSTVDA